RLKMAPVKFLVVLADVFKAFVNATQPTSVLSGHIAHLSAPSFVGIFRRVGVSLDQGGSPIVNDPSFFPIGRADQPLPLPQKTLTGLLESRQIHAPTAPGSKSDTYKMSTPDSKQSFDVRWGHLAERRALAEQPRHKICRAAEVYCVRQIERAPA